MDLWLQFFFPNLCCSHNVDHAQEELTKFWLQVREGGRKFEKILLYFGDLLDPIV